MTIEEKTRVVKIQVGYTHFKSTADFGLDNFLNS